jgi:hypothetical protein
MRRTCLPCRARQRVPRWLSTMRARALRVRVVSGAWRGRLSMGRTTQGRTSSRGYPLSCPLRQRAHPAHIPQEAPGDPRRHPRIPAMLAAESLLSPGIPAYPRSARKRHDRPVTPEVAGSSPVAPVENTLQIGIFCCPSWRNRPPAFRPVTRSSRARHPDAARSRKASKSTCSVAGHGVRVLGHPAAIPQANRAQRSAGADYGFALGGFPLAVLERVARSEA